MHIKEAFVHKVRQRDAVPTKLRCCWLVALSPAKDGQPVVLQSLGSILGNAEPSSGVCWPVFLCRPCPPI